MSRINFEGVLDAAFKKVAAHRGGVIFEYEIIPYPSDMIENNEQESLPNLTIGSIRDAFAKFRLETPQALNDTDLQETGTSLREGMREFDESIELYINALVTKELGQKTVDYDSYVEKSRMPFINSFVQKSLKTLGFSDEDIPSVTASIDTFIRENVKAAVKHELTLLAGGIPGEGKGR